MKKIINHIVCLTICILLPISLIAVEKKAQVGFRFLENPISAEAIAQGGMGVVGIENANTVFWNPSGLGWIDGKNDASASYTRGIADINYGSIASAFTLGNAGIMAVDLTYMDYGIFNGTIRANNDDGFEETGTFTPSAYALGLSFAKRVSDRFSYGVRAKLAYQDLGSVTVGIEGNDVSDSLLVTELVENHHAEPAIDIGASYDFGESGIRFGAVIQNVSREVKYVRESFPLPFAVSFALQADLLKLLGKDNNQHQLDLGIESTHPRDYKEKLKFGFEYKYLGAFIIRGGYRLNYDQRGLTFGIGLKQKIQNMNLRIDYSYEDHGIFNAVNTFTVGTSF
ncbi:MAG: PorV/PorQ family protein [Candidatus Neomarinimicrobiota bacterium]